MDGQEEYENTKEFYSTAVNISASGILINTLKVIDIGDFVALVLRQPDIRINYPVIGVVRRIIEAEEDRINAGIEFLTRDQLDKLLNSAQMDKISEDLVRFDEKDRQALIKFIFTYQIELRKKGLI